MTGPIVMDACALCGGDGENSATRGREDCVVQACSKCGGSGLVPVQTQGRMKA